MFPLNIKGKESAFSWSQGKGGGETLLWTVEGLCSGEIHWRLSYLENVSYLWSIPTISKNVQSFWKGWQKPKPQEKIIKKFWRWVVVFPKNSQFIGVSYGTKDCKDKTLWKKESMIKDVARELRAFIEELETTSVWHPDPEDIRQDDIKIPKLLILFLRNLLTTESPVSERVHRLVKSLAQKIYCVSRGRVKTVKHTQLGIFVKKM